MRQHLLNLPRLIKQGLVVFVDLMLGLLSTWLAFSLRLDTLHWPVGYQWHIYQLTPLLAIPIFVRLGLYRAIFRYTGMAAMGAIVRAVAIHGAILFSLLMWLALPEVPRSVGLLQPMILLVLVASSRALARLWLNWLPRQTRRRPSHRRLMIYGAGPAGVDMSQGLTQSGQFTLIGFLDDNPQLQGKLIFGHTVYSPTEIAMLIGRFDVTDILLAIPSISRGRRNEIIRTLQPYRVYVRSLPDLSDLARGTVKVSDIRELDIEDLLGREPVPPNPVLIGRNVTEKVVLVTGAGGSIGSELCRQILAHKPARLLLLELNEFALYSIHSELLAKLNAISPTTELIPLLANARDYQRLTLIFRTWKPHTVYHAAAYKHVPLVEHNPAEGLRNNVWGTLTAARVSLESEVSDFVLVSTDKAVRPTNIMGASKRLAEMLLQALGASPAPTFEPSLGPAPSHTRFSMVRFGNVLDSSGSVVPKFRQQIVEGGPVTVTHPEVTRFFMTIPEAAQLVLQAGAMAEGGDVFVLDMGEPVRIMDLARRMIELSGLQVGDASNPDGDIAITVTGLRPGEKLYEELLIGENPKPTLHRRIMKAHEDFLPWEILQPHLEQLLRAIEANEVPLMRTYLSQWVSGYQPEEGVVDWVSLAIQERGSYRAPEPMASLTQSRSAKAN